MAARGYQSHFVACAGEDVEAQEGEFAGVVERGEGAFRLDCGADCEGGEGVLEKLFFRGFFRFSLSRLSFFLRVRSHVRLGRSLDLLFVWLPACHIDGRAAAVINCKQPELLEVFFQDDDHANHLDVLDGMIQVEQEQRWIMPTVAFFPRMIRRGSSKILMRL